ncbi:MAG: orotate phosphoribosyltransferase [Sandaracinaceae bacterium]|nr:orotate phosphoribosyltransferase [Sandaracinaceae bacterium]MDW8246630.1 orotate phosphoribosyltransferase [Sandaracinaceae bacterium]
MNSGEVRARLRELLMKHGVLRGSFVLSSGQKSDYFVDCKRVVLRGEGHWLVAQVFLEMLTSWPSVVAVCGVELGGCPLASAVAAFSFLKGRHLDAVYVRKSPKAHGTRQFLEGASHLDLGSPVILLEDVVTTGESSLQAMRKLREAGLDVRAIFALVDRLQGAQERIEREVPFQSVFKVSELL